MSVPSETKTQLTNGKLLNGNMAHSVSPPDTTDTLESWATHPTFEPEGEKATLCTQPPLKEKCYL